MGWPESGILDEIIKVIDKEYGWLRYGDFSALFSLIWGTTVDCKPSPQKNRDIFSTIRECGSLGAQLLNSTSKTVHTKFNSSSYSRQWAWQDLQCTIWPRRKFRRSQHSVKDRLHRCPRWLAHCLKASAPTERKFMYYWSWMHCLILRVKDLPCTEVVDQRMNFGLTN